MKRSKVRQAGAVALIWLAFYAACWFLIYTVVMEFDYRFFFNYLRLAWLGGLEIPSFIQIAALMSSTALTAIFWFLLRRKKLERGR